nr:hypothetical protein KitaXyl93_46990 [Kitasatospora sp. Xyl93]
MCVPAHASAGHVPDRPGPPVNERAGGEDTRPRAAGAEWAKKDGNGQREKDSDVLLRGGRHPSSHSPQHQRPSVILAPAARFSQRYDSSFGPSPGRTHDRKWPRTEEFTYW